MRTRLFFAFCVLVAAGVVGGACAQAAGDFEESEEGSSKGSAGSGSASGAGGATGGVGGSGGDSSGSATGAGGSASMSSAGAGGTGGSGCPDVPCKLAQPQCGCGVDEQCTLDGSLDKTCAPAGTIAVGQLCGLGTDCAPGLLCVTPGGANVSICEEYCDDDSQCTAPGGLCVLTLNDGMGGTLPDVTLCTENCVPSAAASCPVAGTGCQVARETMGQMRFFTLCSGAGSATQGAICTANSDCAPSFGCFDTGAADKVCLKYCKVNSPSCPAATQCVAIQVNMEDVIIGNEQYGACL